MIQDIFANLPALYEALAGKSDIYLVGGCVRDYILNRPIHDIDFTLPANVRPIARRIADTFQGDFYMLDEKRSTARVILKDIHGNPLSLDFAKFQGENLEEDLFNRDFTINALAIPLDHPEQPFDPCHGIENLKNKKLVACTPGALQNDPLRILRGIRLALELGFGFEKDTLQWIKTAVPLLTHISAERLRDEIFRLLESGHAATAFRLLDRFQILPVLFPELVQLKGVCQPLPHQYDVWEHTLALLAELDRLTGKAAPGESENLKLALVASRLGNYKAQIKEHLAEHITPLRPLSGLLVLAGLLHDSGKPACASLDQNNRIHFYRHEQKSAEIGAEWGKKYALSAAETQRLQKIIHSHMRIHGIVKHSFPPSARTIHRFFRDTGPAGVEVILLSLADVAATYGNTISQETWEKYLDTCRVLLDAWWLKREEVVCPPRLLNGNEIQTILGIPPGHLVGKIIQALQEAQAVGEITTRQEAIDFVQKWAQSAPSLHEEDD